MKTTERRHLNFNRADTERRTYQRSGLAVSAIIRDPFTGGYIFQVEAR